jgi:hypothetical protein
MRDKLSQAKSVPAEQAEAVRSALARCEVCPSRDLRRRFRTDTHAQDWLGENTEGEASEFEARQRALDEELRATSPAFVAFLRELEEARKREQLEALEAQQAQADKPRSRPKEARPF